MEKKKFKYSLLALAMTPCFLLAATGCSKKDKLSESKQTEAYSVLRTNIINDNFLTDTNSNAININSSTNYIVSGDWSKSGIPTEKREQASDILDVPLQATSQEYKTENEYGYNTSTNTGYHYEKSMEYDKDAENNKLETKSYKTSEMSFVKQADSEFYKYDYEYNSRGEDDKYVYRVDDKYAINTYKNEAIEQFREGLDPVAKYIKEYDNLNSFKQNLKTIAPNVINNVGELEIPNEIISIATTKLNITLSNGIYSLTTSFDLDNYEAEEGINVGISAKTILKFDNDSIESIEYEIKTSYNSDINCKEVLGSELEGVTFNDNNLVKASMLMEMNASIDLNNPYNESIIPEDVSDYKGTGLNDSIVENNITLNYVYVDFEDCDTSNSTLKYNELLNLNNNSAYLFTSDFVTKDYYWDKECTIPVLETDKAPSYDTNIYVKLTVEEGYAAVLVQRVYSYGETSNQANGVYDLSTDGYTYNVSVPSYYDIIKVTLNDTEVTDYSNGVTITESGIYTIKIYVD